MACSAVLGVANSTAGKRGGSDGPDRFTTGTGITVETDTVQNGTSVAVTTTRVLMHEMIHAGPLGVLRRAPHRALVPVIAIEREGQLARHGSAQGLQRRIHQPRTDALPLATGPYRNRTQPIPAR